MKCSLDWIGRNFEIVLLRIVIVCAALHAQCASCGGLKRSSILEDLDYLVSQLYLQHCTFVEIGEGICSLFVELTLPGCKKAQRKQMFFGNCLCSEFRKWHLCSSKLTGMRPQDCEFQEGMSCSTSSARVHRRLCDITGMSQWNRQCDCSVRLAGAVQEAMCGFKTCYVKSIPRMICGPRTVCGTAHCDVFDHGSLFSVRCDRRCLHHRPFCEDPCPATTLKRSISSHWAEWKSVTPTDSECNMQQYETICLDERKKPTFDCLGPGLYCCNKDDSDCMCEVKMQDGVLKAFRYKINADSPKDQCDYISKLRSRREAHSTNLKGDAKVWDRLIHVASKEDNNSISMFGKPVGFEKYLAKDKPEEDKESVDGNMKVALLDPGTPKQGLLDQLVKLVSNKSEIQENEDFNATYNRLTNDASKDIMLNHTSDLLKAFLDKHQDNALNNEQQLVSNNSQGSLSLLLENHENAGQAIEKVPDKNSPNNLIPLTDMNGLNKPENQEQSNSSKITISFSESENMPTQNSNHEVHKEINNANNLKEHSKLVQNRNYNEADYKPDEQSKNVNNKVSNTTAVFLAEKSHVVKNENANNSAVNSLDKHSSFINSKKATVDSVGSLDEQKTVSDIIGITDESTGLAGKSQSVKNKTANSVAVKGMTEESKIATDKDTKTINTDIGNQKDILEKLIQSYKEKVANVGNVTGNVDTHEQSKKHSPAGDKPVEENILKLLLESSIKTTATYKENKGKIQNLATQTNTTVYDKKEKGRASLEETRNPEDEQVNLDSENLEKELESLEDIEGNKKIKEENNTKMNVTEMVRETNKVHETVKINEKNERGNNIFSGSDKNDPLIAKNNLKSQKYNEINGISQTTQQPQHNNEQDSNMDKIEKSEEIISQIGEDIKKYNNKDRQEFLLGGILMGDNKEKGQENSLVDEENKAQLKESDNQLSVLSMAEVKTKKDYENEKINKSVANKLTPGTKTTMKLSTKVKLQTGSFKNQLKDRLAGTERPAASKPQPHPASTPERYTALTPERHASSTVEQHAAKTPVGYDASTLQQHTPSIREPYSASILASKSSSTKILHTPMKLLGKSNTERLVNDPPNGKLQSATINKGSILITKPMASQSPIKHISKSILYNSDKFTSRKDLSTAPLNPTWQISMNSPYWKEKSTTLSDKLFKTAPLNPSNQANMNTLSSGKYTNAVSIASSLTYKSIALHSPSMEINKNTHSVANKLTTAGIHDNKVSLPVGKNIEKNHIPNYKGSSLGETANTVNIKHESKNPSVGPSPKKDDSIKQLNPDKNEKLNDDIANIFPSSKFNLNSVTVPYISSKHKPMPSYLQDEGESGIKEDIKSITTVDFLGALARKIFKTNIKSSPDDSIKILSHSNPLFPSPEEKSHDYDDPEPVLKDINKVDKENVDEKTAEALSKLADLKVISGNMEWSEKSDIKENSKEENIEGKENLSPLRSTITKRVRDLKKRRLKSKVKES